jgi:hypothetical protein
MKVLADLVTLQKTAPAVYQRGAKEELDDQIFTSKAPV